ncbi:MAG TPA: T9SS type A sorting domain-containing protein, partial [candidate division WOR-3 bacterium]|nr:T9SS type A sorting domain-containing protein [candidate division WOR-3 bacterium]
EGRDGVASAGRVPGGAAYVRVGPNPLVGGLATLRYSLPKAGPAAVAVYDVAGRSVFSTRTPGHLATGSLSLDMRSLSAGIYLVQVEAGDYSATQKLVVQK